MTLSFISGGRTDRSTGPKKMYRRAESSKYRMYKTMVVSMNACYERARWRKWWMKSCDRMNMPWWGERKWWARGLFGFMLVSLNLKMHLVSGQVRNEHVPMAAWLVQLCRPENGHCIMLKGTSKNTQNEHKECISTLLVLVEGASTGGHGYCLELLSDSLQHS